MLGSIGTRQDLEIRQAAEFDPVTVNIRDAAGSIVNITNATIRGYLKKAYSSQTAVEFDVSITDGPNGVFTFGMSSAKTAALPVNSTREQYVYGIDMTLNSKVEPLLYGTAFVYRRPAP